MVRLISALLLHLQQMSELDRCRAMVDFLVDNANKFSSGSLIFPAFICLVRLLIAFSIEIGGIINILYLDDELLVIKFAAVLGIIGTIDAKMSPLIYRDISSTIKA